MISLAIRTLPVFAVIIGFAMALAAYMNFSGVRSAYLDLIRSRMSMMADDIGTDIAAAHALGIRLSEQTTLPPLLARQAGSDPLMLSIDILGDNGQVLFSSDPGRVGLEDNAALDGRGFRQEHRIVNDFGAPVGVVVVRLDRAAVEGTIEAFRVDIFKNAVPAGLGAVLAGSLICLLLLVRLHRRAERSALGRAGDDPIAKAAQEVEQALAERPS